MVLGMRASLRFLLAIAATSSLLAIASTAASADDGTLGGLIGTTDLIGILGGINLPQINVPDGTDPTATDPAQGGTNTTTTPAPTSEGTEQPVLTHSLGYYCKGESKRRVSGQTRTPFSKCVAAMRKLAHGSSSSAQAACRGLPRRRVSGARRSAYAICVAGGKQLLSDLGK
jgi:hypothetical protein